MKFTIGSKTLQQQLSAVFRVINTKSPLSILENFLFTLDGNHLTVKGSDQENIMIATVEVNDAEGDGTVAVPAKRILDMLKELPDQGLNIEIDEESLNIKMDFAQGNFDFMGLPGNEYPESKQRSDDAVPFSMPASVMLSGLENTLYAASLETIRPIMTGVCVDFKQDSLVFVASDTHKLVKFETTMVRPGFERRIVMPPKASQLLRALLDKEEGEISMVIDSQGATFRWSGFELSCVFIVGNYPPYDRVIPQNNPFSMEADRNSMLAACRRMALTANTGSRMVSVDLKEGMLELTANDADYARSGHETVPCTYDGNNMTLGMNVDYMVEVVSNIPGDSIAMTLSDPSRPVIFMPADQPEGAKLIVLLMTMHVQN